MDHDADALGAEPAAEAPRPSRSSIGLAVGLYALALLLACGCAFGAVLVRQRHVERDRALQEQVRYGDVLAAARTEVEAFVNIDYRSAQESIDAVAAGATGEFAAQYDSSTDGVARVLQRQRSVMDGTVLWAGVVDIDAERATVLAATTGTVSNVSTKGREVRRDFRLRLELQRVDGRWLTDDLQFVA